MRDWFLRFDTADAQKEFGMSQLKTRCVVMAPTAILFGQSPDVEITDGSQRTNPLAPLTRELISHPKSAG
jgi:hypothetical protein